MRNTERGEYRVDTMEEVVDKIKGHMYAHSGDMLEIREVGTRAPIQVTYSPTIHVIIPTPQVGEVTTITRKDAFGLLFDEEVLSELFELIKKTKENFNDLSNREIYFAQFYNKLNGLWEIYKHMDNYSKHITMLLQNSCKNKRSEDLSLKEVDAILEVVYSLKEGKIERDAFKKAMKILMKNKLKPLPDLTGIADSYLDI